ncbi:MAG: sigma 54-interacting transcriptional regulator [Polyangiaceae bacterium]
MADRSFRLLRSAGSGGFGSVWQAVSETGRIVALKWAHDAAGAAALAREAEVAALALSPRLPELVDTGWARVPTSVAAGATVETCAGPRSGARPFVAFAWVDGEPLDARPPKAEPEALRDALALAADTAEALADLHGIGAAHGDVKPQNLLVDARGRVHVIDLGLCVGAFSTDLAGATARYLATDDGELGDARARDLLALGVVLAERVSVTVRAARDAVTAARLAALPAPLDEICGALLSRSPAARASARWVLGAARAALARLPVHHGRRSRAHDATSEAAHAHAAHETAHTQAHAAHDAAHTHGHTAHDASADRAGRHAHDASAEHATERADRDARAVRASYLRLRRAEIARATRADSSTAPWLAEALALAARARSLLGSTDDARASAEEPPLGPLSIDGVVRWLVLLCGPHAAAWPVALATSSSEAALAETLVELARRIPPEAWTFRDVEEASLGRTTEPATRAHVPIRTTGRDAATMGRDASPTMDAEAAARLALAVAEVPPDAGAMGLVEADRSAPAPLVLAAADALRRSGELGRARSLVLRDGVLGAPGGHAIAADVLRRAGEPDHARRLAMDAIHHRDDAAGRARATLARIALDAGHLDEAADLTADAALAPVAEVAALVAHRRGDGPRALADVARGEALARTPEERARLAATRGYVLHATDPEGAFGAFAAAVEYAMRAGAVVEEATYRTGLAASAADLGDLGVAITSARRAAVLWEVLGRPALAARALLACAAALATARSAHEARAAAREAIDRAREGGDARAEAYAFWAIADALPAGDPEARGAAESADVTLRAPEGDDALRSAARLLRHGSRRVDDARKKAADEAAADPARSVAARLEWWGARAEALVGGDTDLTSAPARDEAAIVLQSLLALTDARAPVGTRGPALFAAYELGARLGRSDAAARLLSACHEIARHLIARAPADLGSHIRALPWAVPSALAASGGMKLEQAAELERILRTLADRERLGVLLDRVVDALVLWTGVERGLLLMRAPDGRLLPRAARNLARADLAGEQLALSHTLAQRALETRAPVVAVDAAGELSSVVQSVHALKLRSVLALPLIARGEVLGVVYLDDRLRRGAFGPRELSWAQTIAQLAAVAILDARTNVLLRRAVRRAERASAELAETLARREAEVDTLARELSHQRTGRATRHRYDRIIGESDAIQKLLGLVDRVTASDVPVLVFGESGSGKELLARAIHDNGPRASRPFVGENCGAIPESLLESALFGHVRGAFTGADRPRAGLFEVADRGTLFLDEIGEMSLTMQTKLLRVLEDGLVKPLGSERARKVDVRVIAATHRDLEAMVKARTFREDLYYRLHIVALRIPPLRARPSDIPLLVQHFVKIHAKGHDVRITKAAMAKLLAFGWPGNVRQLENEIRRAIVLSDGVIDVDQLSPEVSGTTTIARAHEGGLNVRDRIDALEIDLVQKALERTRGNQTQAAKLLGLSRFGLQKMMKRLGLGSSASATTQPESSAG